MAGTAAHARDAHGLRQAICPISPAKPWLPRTNRPWAITAPPMPVPAAIIMQVSSPAGGSRRASPSAWACTSLSTETGSSQDSCKRSLMGWPVHPGMISLAYAIPPMTASTRPAVDTPMPSTCSRRERLGEHRVRHIAHGDEHGAAPRCACVGTWVSNTTSGAASICSYRSSARRFFVPPMSSAATYAGYSSTAHPSLFEKHLITWCQPWYSKQKSRRGWNLRRLLKAKKSYLRMGASASMRPAFLMTSTMAATSSPPRAAEQARASGSC